MYCRFQPLAKLLSQQIKTSTRLHFSDHTRYKYYALTFFSIPNQQIHQISTDKITDTNDSTNYTAHKIQSLLSVYTQLPIQDVEKRLTECNLFLSEDLILKVLRRHHSDWKSAFVYFNWIHKSYNSVGSCLTTSIYNEVLDILGRNKRLEELLQVLDEMSKRKHYINERTYGIVVGRFASAHKVDEAIEFFYKIEPYFGLKHNLVAFQTLLLSLCRYKHVEVAELLFRNKKNEFEDDIKTWNIILNGWCVLGSLPDVKRFWKDIVTSKCKPDKYTYGIFINALSKSGKISTAKKLLRTMWENECNPDATICNTVIDGLCFKKRIPEALKIFNEMKERDCLPNVATYNSLIKHLCKIQRMVKVDELLNEMERTDNKCCPDALTYGYLMKVCRRPEQVDNILERMVKSGCTLDADTYNLVLKLFMEWGDEERLKRVWFEMETSGVGPDRRSYTILIHGFYNKGAMWRVLEYFSEMTARGMVPDPKTKILVDDINVKLKDGKELGEMGLNSNIRLGRSCNLRKKAYSLPVKLKMAFDSMEEREKLRSHCKGKFICKEKQP